MRDPKRIASIITQLSIYWYNNPDLRLGQIVSNVAAIGGNQSNDVYYFEDTDIYQVLVELNKAAEND